MLVLLRVLSEWHAGADVGGGNVSFATEYTVANASLRWPPLWMVKEIVQSQITISFDYRESAKYSTIFR
jgi:hypothetical protein